MSFENRPIRHSSIITTIEFDSPSNGNFHDPLINSAIMPNCTNDEEIARQAQEQLYAQSLMNTGQPSMVSSIDMRTVEELEADEALARKLQEEEYTRKSIVPNRSWNNHRSRTIQTDAELAAQLQEEENKKQRQQRLATPIIPGSRQFQNPSNNRSNAPEIVQIPPFLRNRQQPARRDRMADSDSDDDVNNNQPAVQSTRNRPNRNQPNRNNNIRPHDIFSMLQPILVGAIRGRHNRHLENTSDDFGPDDYENLLELDRSVAHKPLTVEQINRLPTEKFRRTAAKTAEESTCNICWDDFEDNQTTRRLPCLHSYHKDCIDKWLKTNNTCPICRISANQ